MGYGTKQIAKAAIDIAMTESREEERELIDFLAKEGIIAAAADFGGEFTASVSKIIERAVVAAKREGLINDTHTEEGAVVGAAREALSGIMNKAIGMNVGGKIAIAKYQDNIFVCTFFAIGFLHLNEIAIGLGHRVM